MCVLWLWHSEQEAITENTTAKIKKIDAMNIPPILAKASCIFPRLPIGNQNIPSSLIWPQRLTLVGKSVRNSAKFRNSSDSGPFEPRNFHQNFIFLIIKCVPANSEHISSGFESFPTINSSNFMNPETFPPSVFFLACRKEI
jgi:hypothetical protein